MKLSTKSRYAVMAMAYIAKHRDRQPISLQEIATDQKISLSFLEQIFYKLRQNNIVTSIRGPRGGYQINIELSDISISKIFTAVDESFKMTRCSKGVGCIEKSAKCMTHDLWKGMTTNMISYLNSISLEDLINNNINGHGHLLR